MASPIRIFTPEAQNSRERTARYRARKLGEDIPLRKTGRVKGIRWKGPNHGTLYEYGKFGCRCEMCVGRRDERRKAHPRKRGTPREIEYRKEYRAKFPIEFAMLDMLRHLSDQSFMDENPNDPWTIRQRELSRARSRANYRANPYSVTTKLRKASDPAFRILLSLRSRASTIMKRAQAGKKCSTTLDLLGCSMEYFVKFIERQFTKGMSWLITTEKGTGKWNLDHRQPCASFDLSDEWQQRWCFHYSNLQPMWASENARKNDTYPMKIKFRRQLN